MEMVKRQCVREGIFPVEWKKARVVVLLEGKGKARDSCKCYRPRSLLLLLGKIFERVLVGRLYQRVAGLRFLRLFGFARGDGTKDAWYKVIRIISGIFADLGGAFNNL